jgi:hypothetical protein
MGLQVLEKAVVVSVPADPEPSHLLVLQKPKGPVSESHADGVNRVAIVNFLEVEARMAGVLPKQALRLPGEVSDLRWQLAIRRPEARRRE